MYFPSKIFPYCLYVWLYHPIIIDYSSIYSFIIITIPTNNTNKNVWTMVPIFPEGLVNNLILVSKG